MELYSKQLAKAQRQKSSITADVEMVLIFETSNITDKIKKRWSWGRGVNGGGIVNKETGLPFYRSNEYKMFKMRKNPNAKGTVDLILTGSLSNKLMIKKLGSLFQVISTDSKFQKIGYKYGFEQFNLTAAETEILKAEIIEKILINYTFEVWQNV